MIEKVIKLAANVEFDGFGEGEGLFESNVCGYDRIPAKYRARRVSEGKRSRCGECGCVKPPRDASLAGWQPRIAKQNGPDGTGRKRVCGVCIRNDGERGARHKSLEHSQLPSAQCTGEDSIVPGKRESRNSIGRRQHEMMRNIAAAESFVQPPIVGIHVTAGIAVLVGRLDVIKKPGERVVREERNFPNTFLRPDEAAVVGRVSNGWVDPRHVAELRKRPSCLRVATAH